MNLLGIAGSLRDGSYNRQLLEAAGNTLGGLTPFASFRSLRARKLSILKWRDVRVVEGARLESNPVRAC
jgi:hypothetical protein